MLCCAVIWVSVWWLSASIGLTQLLILRLSYLLPIICLPSVLPRVVYCALRPYYAVLAHAPCRVCDRMCRVACGGAALAHSCSVACGVQCAVRAALCAARGAWRVACGGVALAHRVVEGVPRDLIEHGRRLHVVPRDVARHLRDGIVAAIALRARDHRRGEPTLALALALALNPSVVWEDRKRGGHSTLLCGVKISRDFNQ